MFRMSDVGASAKKKIVWVGDACVASGFACATHHILDVLCEKYLPIVLGINYNGDPHKYRYPIFAAGVKGDWSGSDRLPDILAASEPEMILIQQDGWNFPDYVRRVRHQKSFDHIPIVGIVAVDGKNFDGRWIKDLDHAIFWTKFALDEARAGGYDGPASVIPLGVDLKTFYPVDRYEARQFRLPRELDDAFIIGNVNRNQPRKRWDLTVKYFAQWVKRYKIENAYLYLHTAPTGEAGIDVHNLAKYYEVLDRMILVQPQMWYGIEEQHMKDTYNCFDLQISTTQGEGFGLTTFEGMACGVPQIVPGWSALEEICKDAAWIVPCTTTAIGMPYVNVIGGVPDEELFIQALQAMYANPAWREQNSRAGLERVSQSRYRWENVARAFGDVIDGVTRRVQETEEREAPQITEVHA